MVESWKMSMDITLPGGKPAVGPRLGRIIEVLSECLIPDGGRIPVSLEGSGAYKTVARYLRDQDPGTRLGLKALLVLFDLLPFLFIGRFKRFVNLAPQERELYLMDWYASRIYLRRMVPVLLKTVTGMGYYNDPAVLKSIGFELPCGGREGAP